MDDLTSDTFFDGNIQVRQHRRGYRFSIDAVLLAFHAGLRPVSRILDIGTGCGIIPLILACRLPEIRIFGVEIQPELATLAAANVRDNGFGERITILHQDMKSLKQAMTAGPVDLVVSNPPYRKVNSGRINPDSQKAVARHEIRASLADVTDTARRLLDVSGRFIVIYPAERTAELLSRMQDTGLEPKFLRPVCSAAGTDAKLVIAEGMRGGRPGMKLGPPLIIYRTDGTYTDEVNRMFMP